MLKHWGRRLWRWSDKWSPGRQWERKRRKTENEETQHKKLLPEFPLKSYMYKLHINHQVWSQTAVWRTYCCRPARFVVMDPAGENHQPDKSHDEAEDGHGHDPALRVCWIHIRAGNQDPHQTTENLQKHHSKELMILRYSTSVTSLRL